MVREGRGGMHGYLVVTWPNTSLDGRQVDITAPHSWPRVRSKDEKG